jgi:curved DNA-binding protein CbpA
MDHYAVLQVDPTADAEVIRAAYRVLARRHHPDAGGSASRMAQINEAWSVLGNARRRRVYDREHGYVRSGPSLATRTAAAAARSAAASPEAASATSGWGSSRTGRPDRTAPPRPGPARRESGPAHPNDAHAARPDSAQTPPEPRDRVLDFGRYAGWSILDLSHSDPDYLLWLERTPIGRAFRSEIARALDLRRVAAPAIATAGAGRAPSTPSGWRLARWFR